jgi:hypothetical protein
MQHHVLVERALLNRRIEGALISVAMNLVAIS